MKRPSAVVSPPAAPTTPAGEPLRPAPKPAGKPPDLRSIPVHHTPYRDRHTDWPLTRGNKQEDDS